MSEQKCKDYKAYKDIPESMLKTTECYFYDFYAETCEHEKFEGKPCPWKGEPYAQA